MNIRILKFAKTLLRAGAGKRTHLVHTCKSAENPVFIDDVTLAHLPHLFLGVPGGEGPGELRLSYPSLRCLLRVGKNIRSRWDSHRPTKWQGRLVPDGRRRNGS